MTYAPRFGAIAVRVDAASKAKRPRRTEMTDTRPHFEPGPDHRITVQACSGHVTVRRGQTVIGQTDRALELREADYPPVLYFPLADIDQRLLRASDEHSYCPYKGEASYYDILGGDDETLAGAVWYYPEPYDAVGSIRDHVAFYADRVAITREP
jgi:uncharacterized protein (DUF427 family)